MSYSLAKEDKCLIRIKDAFKELKGPTVNSKADYNSFPLKEWKIKDEK